MQSVALDIKIRKGEIMDLYAQGKKQDPSTVFAHFRYDGRRGESYFTPFQQLANMAKPENWNFEHLSGPKDLPILRKYLFYTFRRLQEQDKIAYSADKTLACFNTGLQTPDEKDIFALFFENKRAKEFNAPKWTFLRFADSYNVKDIYPLPSLATYWNNTSELVFDLSYEIELQFDHIYDDNKLRLPIELQENRMLALHALKGAVEVLKEKIRRNYKLASPHWYEGHVQLLLPLCLLDPTKADVALVVDKDESRKIYRGTTILEMYMAYLDARLICRPDKDWLNP